MVKENHTQKTVIMPIALEDRLIAYVQATKDTQRRGGVRSSERTTESGVICNALEAYLEPLKHERSG